MRITIKRSPVESTPTYTHGRLFTEESGFLCWTLEDADRGLTNDMPLERIKAIKRYGETAIPKGTYRIQMCTSPKLHTKAYAQKYGGKLPMVCDVPGWTGVYIHPFNSPEESLGCIAPGVLKGDIRGRIFESTRAFYDLMDFYVIPAVERGEDIYLTIE